MTLATWFRVASYPHAYGLMEWWDGASYGVHMHLASGGFQWYGLDNGVNLVDTDGHDQSYVMGIADPSANEWHHMVYTYDVGSGLGKLYLDGELERTEDFGPVDPQTSYGIHFGRIRNDFHLDGQLDEIRIYNHALDLAAIQELYAEGSSVGGDWLTDWSGSYAGGAAQPVCEHDAGWVTVTGSVSITPPGAMAILETQWRVLNNASNAAPPDCPPSDPDCTSLHIASQVVTGDTTFTISGWWPGVRCDDQAVAIEFGADLLDEHGAPVSSSMDLDVNWDSSVCAAPDCDSDNDGLPDDWEIEPLLRS